MRILDRALRVLKAKLRRKRHDRQLSNEIPKLKVISTAEKDVDYYNLLNAVGRNPSFKQEIFDLRAAKQAEILTVLIDDPHMDRKISYNMGEINTLDHIIYNIILRAEQSDQLRDTSIKPKER